jgi:SAM-dependent methyltransferase
MKVLEVGAGTGLATMAFARRGLHLHCLEPSHGMAELLAARSMPNVTTDVVSFSDSQVAPGGYDAVIAGQCWHYLDPAIRLKKSAFALGDRGILAVFWSSLPHPGKALAAGFKAAYQAHAPELQLQAKPAGQDRPQQRFAENSDLFEDVVLKKYQGSCRFGAEEFTSLLDTYGEYYALPPHRRSALYAALQRHISNIAESVEMKYESILYMARVCGR